MTQRSVGEPLHHAKQELRAAEHAIGRMKGAKTLEDLEEAWKGFLDCIEKVWIKAERACERCRNRFQPWQGKFANERRKDPLLRYVKHARNSDQHSIQECMDTKTASGSMHVEGPDVYIEKLVIRNRQLVEYRGSQPLIVEHLPDRVELVRIKDSGDWYNPPTSHLGKRLPWPAPIDVAVLALAYYREFVRLAEEKFFRNAA